MELDTLKDLYVEELKDLYSAEKQIVKALPKLIKAAKDPELKAAFKTHLKQTGEHAKRLEMICKELGVSPRGKKCVGMEGLLEEGSDLIKEKPDEDVLDAGLISAAQHVEHYEMPVTEPFAPMRDSSDTRTRRRFYSGHWMRKVRPITCSPISRYLASISKPRRSTSGEEKRPALSSRPFIA